MKTLSTKNIKYIFLVCVFFALSASYIFNLWRIVDNDFFHYFERQPEALTIGRLVRAQSDGVWSKGGFPGVNHYKTSELEEPHPERQSFQHDLYLLEKETPPYFSPYLSQTGGQGIAFASLDKLLPFSNYTNLKIFRAINCLLLALLFVFFIDWVWRNFCKTTAILTFSLLLFTPWITFFAHNIWWSLWSFYLPFVALMLYLERGFALSAKRLNLVYLIAFATIFTKCFFTGFEFISTTLVSAMCPVIYYLILSKTKLKISLEIFGKTALAMVAGALAEMGILILQLRYYYGNFTEAFNYISSTFIRRASAQDGQGLLEVLASYLKGNTLAHSLVAETYITIYFGVVIVLMAVSAFIVLYRKAERTAGAVDKNRALVYTSLISLLAPLSWFIIFKGHAAIHPHLDYIVWYMPSFIFGYILIAKALVVPRKDNTCTMPD